MEWIKKLLEGTNAEDGKLDIEGTLSQIKTEFPKHAVPKETFNDVSTQLKAANDTIGTLKKEHGNVEALQTTIKMHEGTIQTMKDDHEKTLNSMAITSAIEKVLNGAKAKHPDLLSAKFDLDKYINGTLEVKIGGETISIKQPSAKQTMAISALEKNDTLENKCKITAILLNNNTNDKKFTQEEIERIPFSAHNALIMAVISMRVEQEKDPN